MESGVNLNMTGGTLDANSAAYGGGVYVTSGSTMTLTGGTVGSADGKTGNSANNGAGIYVAGGSGASHGTLRVENGSISGNKAGTYGGGVYLDGNGQLHVSGGTISYNAADDTNGGAINAEGVDARIYLSGNPTIFNNPDNAATQAQKNLVLSVNQNTIINTEEEGLKNKPTKGVGGTVGIYVIDKDSANNDVYTEHGVYDKPFGTYGGTGGEDRGNARHLVNDRNLGLYGVQKEDNSIYWLDVVCKVTNASDELLYKRINVDNSGVYVYVPAVYTSLAEGLDALNGWLYRKNGSRYANANTGAVKVKMLKDYELDKNELITYTKERTVTLMTAEKKDKNTDGFFYVPAQGATGESLTKATLTRAQTVASMFTVTISNYNFNVTDLIIDGGSNTMLTQPDINGGAFNFRSVHSSTFTRVTLKNLNATGNGGAIYLNSGSLTLTGSNVDYGDTSLTGNVAKNGGAVYVDSGSLTLNSHSRLTDNVAEENGGAVYVCSGASATLSSGTVKGNTATNGAGFYLTENCTLNITGKPDFGGTDREGGNGADKDDLKGTEGNFVRKDAASFKRSDNEPTNGGKLYPRYGEDYLIRQDIYIAGYADTNPAASLAVTGKITSGNGTIWVWAEKQEHYEMLKQFAQFSGRGTRLNNADKESSMEAFRNAQPDELTICGGDYLTGQRGEFNNWIYWTGGYDVVFLKVDGFGDPLPGATFRLYTDEACTTSYDMSFADGKRPTTISSDGTATYKDKDGVTQILKRGEVLLSKVAPKTYYMKETALPSDAYAESNKDVIYRVTVSKTGELKLEKKNASGSYEEVYKLDDQYRVMDISALERKVVLRKIDGSSYASLAGARFRIFCAPDLTEVIQDGYNSANSCYESGPNGVYFVGSLPLGNYYLVEIAAPTKADGMDTTSYGGNVGRVFTLRVGTGDIEPPTPAATAINVTPADAVPARLKEWIQKTP